MHTLLPTFLKMLNLICQYRRTSLIVIRFLINLFLRVVGTEADGDVFVSLVVVVILILLQYGFVSMKNKILAAVAFLRDGSAEMGLLMLVCLTILKLLIILLNLLINNRLHNLLIISSANGRSEFVFCVLLYFFEQGLVV